MPLPGLSGKDQEGPPLSSLQGDRERGWAGQETQQPGGQRLGHPPLVPGPCMLDVPWLPGCVEHWGALGHSRELGRARLVFGGQWGISQKGNGPLVPLGLELRPLCSIFPEKPGRGFCSQTRCPSGGWVWATSPREQGLTRLAGEPWGCSGGGVSKACGGRGRWVRGESRCSRQMSPHPMGMQR